MEYFVREEIYFSKTIYIVIAEKISSFLFFFKSKKEYVVCSYTGDNTLEIKDFLTFHKLWAKEQLNQMVSLYDNYELIGTRTHFISSDLSHKKRVKFNSLEEAQEYIKNLVLLENKVMLENVEKGVEKRQDKIVLQKKDIR